MMQLLPGYRVTMKQGIDSAVGDISLQGGLTINFDLWGNAGNYVDSAEVKQNALWRREQIIAGRKVICTYTKSHYMYVTFPPSTNFFARTRNQQDLTDMLLMVLTFHSPSRDPLKNKPPDSSPVGAK
jgi:hypothetical protein